MKSIERCGKCKACKEVEIDKKLVLSQLGVSVAHTDRMVELWNDSLMKNLCEDRQRRGMISLDIKQGGVNVYVKIENEGIVVDAYELATLDNRKPDPSPIATTYMFWHELGIKNVEFEEPE